MPLRCICARLIIVISACLQPSAFSHLWAAAAESVSVEKPKTLEEMAAKDGFTDLTICERELFRAATVGIAANCGTAEDTDPSNDPVNDDSPHLWSSAREVRGEVVRWLVHKAQAEVDPRGIRIRAARVKGALDLSYLTIPFPLSFVQTHFREAANLEGTTVKGYFECSKSRFDNDFSLADTDIADFIDCGGAKFNQTGDLEHNKYAINVRFAKVAGSIWLSDVESRGPATFIGTQCHNLTLINAKFADKVFLANMKVEGDVEADRASFSSRESRPTPLGDLALIAINMVVTSSVRLSANNGSLDLANLKAYRLIITGKSSPGFKLDLRSATIGILRDEKQGWPQSGNLTLDGLVYGDFEAGSQLTAIERLEWVRLSEFAKPRAEGLETQPYLQLAKNRKDHGDDEGEKEVLIGLHDDLITHGNLTTTSAIWEHVLGWTIGYGYRPLRAAIFILAFVIVGSVIFWEANRRRLMIPTDSDVYDSYFNTGYVPEYYPTFKSTIYALETFLPLVDLGQSKFWKPRENIAEPAWVGRWLQRYTWTHVILGWFFTTIFVAGIAGIIPK